MRENLSTPKSGQAVSASYLNRVSGVARKMSAGASSSHCAQIHNESMRAFALPSPFVKHVMHLLLVDNETKIHTGRLRYFNHSLDQWVTDGVDYQIDTKSDSREFSYDDKILAYWDSNRGMFVGVSNG